MKNIDWMTALSKKKDNTNVIHSKKNIDGRNKEIQRQYWQNFNNKFMFGVDSIDCSDKDLRDYAEYVDEHRDYQDMSKDLNYNAY